MCKALGSILRTARKKGRREGGGKKEIYKRQVSI
jgi:hypothetical protein